MKYDLPEYLTPEGRKDWELRELISSLAMNMVIVGTVSLLAGFLLLGVALFFVFKRYSFLNPQIPLMQGIAVQGAITMLIGGFTVRAGWAFLRIGRSPQITVGNLTKPIKDLRNLYSFQVIILGFALALALIGALFAPWRG
jgi:cytochrome bd-type quinol oxidase subunit 1